MRLLLKLFAAPVMLALTILAAMLMFLFDICSFLLTVASVITALLGVGLFFTPTPHGGFIFLFLAFLLWKCFDTDSRTYVTECAA